MINTVLNCEQINTVESTLFKNGMNPESLIERVSIKIDSYIHKRYPIDCFPSVGLFIGGGHNGADGLAVAKELILNGYKVLVYLTSSPLKKITSENLRYFEFIGGKVTEDKSELSLCSFFVDAIFGLGLTRILSKEITELINWINHSKKPVIAIDLPSGLHSDYGVPMGNCVQATDTLCLGVIKQGLIQDTAVDFVGHLVLLDIGFSPALKQIQFEAPILIRKINIKQFIEKENFIKKRSSNKFNKGLLFIFAGSQKYPGAALLAGQGALATKLGYIKLITEQQILKQLLQENPDIVFSDIKAGLLELKNYLGKKQFTILYGCGLDNNKNLKEILSIIKNVDKKFAPTLLIDADGLQEVPECIKELKEYIGEKIITPHSGEFQRIFPDIYVNYVKKYTDISLKNPLDKIQCAKQAAQMIHGIVLLKGPHTVICDHNNHAFVNYRASPALARAGSGDILSGLITGLITQGNSALKASCLGVYLHGQAGLDSDSYFKNTRKVGVSELPILIQRRLKKLVVLNR